MIMLRGRMGHRLSMRGIDKPNVWLRGRGLRIGGRGLRIGGRGLTISGCVCEREMIANGIVQIMIK